MTFQKKRALHIGGASWLLLGAMHVGALADDTPTQLPDVTVTAPSPIQRHRTVPTRTPTRAVRAAPSRNSERVAAAQPVPTAPAPQQGVLPVVTDQFATVTVVPSEELRRSGGATLEIGRASCRERV